MKIWPVRSTGTRQMWIGVAVTIAMALLIGLFLLHISEAKNTGDGNKIFRTHTSTPSWGPGPLSSVSSPFPDLAGRLKFKMSHGQFDPNDLEKLDFTYPDQPGFGKNPSFEVFNPAGPFNQPQVRNYQSSLDSVTTRKGVRPIFNLRRTVNSKGTTDTLYIIIPNVTEKACEDVAKHVWFETSQGEKYPPATVKFNHALKFPSDNHHIVVDPSPIPPMDEGVCVELPDGNLYTFRTIAYRFRPPGTVDWRR